RAWQAISECQCLQPQVRTVHQHLGRHLMIGRTSWAGQCRSKGFLSWLSPIIQQFYGLVIRSCREIVCKFDAVDVNIVSLCKVEEGGQIEVLVCKCIRDATLECGISLTDNHPVGSCRVRSRCSVFRQPFSITGLRVNSLIPNQVKGIL